MNRPVYVLNILPRENRHIEPRVGRDVWEIIKLATCLFLYGVIAVVVLA